MSEALAIRTVSPSVPARPEPFVPTTLDEFQKLGTLLASSGYFKDAREAAQCVAKILVGAEIGIPPMAALMGISIVEGKPTIGGTLAAAVIRASGRYDYRVLEHDDGHCLVAIFLRGKEIGRSSFTLAEAQQAGLAGKQNWKAYPKDMCFARAITRAARQHCPDAFSGLAVYDPDELADVGTSPPDAGLSRPAFAESPPAAPAVAPRSPLGQGAALSAEPTPPQRWSRAQLNRFFAQLQPLRPKVTPDELHAILGVLSIQDWDRDLDEAVKLVFEHRQREADADRDAVDHDGDHEDGVAGVEHPFGSVEAEWERYTAAVRAAAEWNNRYPEQSIRFAEPPRDATAAQLRAYAEGLERRLAKLAGGDR